MECIAVSNVHHSFSKYKKIFQFRRFLVIHWATLSFLDTDKANCINYGDSKHMREEPNIILFNSYILFVFLVIIIVYKT